MQHAIQDIERFAQGTSVSESKRQIENEIKEINDKIKSGDIGFIEKIKQLAKDGTATNLDCV